MFFLNPNNHALGSRFWVLGCTAYTTAAAAVLVSPLWAFMFVFGAEEVLKKLENQWGEIMADQNIVHCS